MEIYPDMLLYEKRKEKQVRFWYPMPGPFLVYNENAEGEREKDFSQGDGVAKAGMQGDGRPRRSRRRSLEERGAGNAGGIMARWRKEESLGIKMGVIPSKGKNRSDAPKAGQVGGRALRYTR